MRLPFGERGRRIIGKQVVGVINPDGHKFNEFTDPDGLQQKDVLTYRVFEEVIIIYHAITEPSPNVICLEARQRTSVSAHHTGCIQTHTLATSIGYSVGLLPWQYDRADGDLHDFLGHRYKLS